MDWRDLLEERNRREQARRAGRVAGSTATIAPAQPEADDGGFFGGLGRKISQAPGFFGKLAGGLANAFVEPIEAGVGKVTATLTSPGKKKALDEKLRKGEITQEEYNAQLKEVFAKDVGSKVVEEGGETKVVSKNPLEFAKGFFETGTDVGVTYAPLTRGASVGLKAAGQYKKLGDVAAPLLKEGLAYGTAQTAADVVNDRDVNIPANYLLGVGGSFAGYGLGRAGSAGVKTAKQLGADERGFIQPFGDAIDEATDAADIARRQLAGEAVDTGDVAESVAAQYGSLDEYIDDIARRALGDESTRGVSLIPGAEQYGYGRRRATEHAPWYRELFAETGRKPSIGAVKERVRNALETGSDGGGLVPPEESQVYRLLQDRDAGLAATMAEGPPPDMMSQFMADLGIPQPATRAAMPSRRVPAGLPRGRIRGQEALEETMGLPQLLDTEGDLQRALGRMEAETNPLIDYIDPLKRGGIPPANQVELPVTPSGTYAGVEPDLTRPALPAPETPAMTSREAKAALRRTGEAPAEFLDTKAPGKAPIELPANAEELAKAGTRMTKGGKVKPFKLVSTDEVEAIRTIAADDTSSAFTVTRTPELNLEEAFRTRGGTKSKGFRVLDRFNISIREHTADYTRDVQAKRSFLERFIREYGIDGRSAGAMRPYLEAADSETSEEALKAYRLEFGDKAADGLKRLRQWWRSEKRAVREDTNKVIEEFAGPDRTIGDLGEAYVPRVYRAGRPGFKQSVLDVAHGKMENIGGNKGMFNLENNAGYLSKETETMGGVLRNSEGIPLNSEYAKPKTTFLSAAQKRKAKEPVRELEDPLTSMMRYFEATSRAKHLTPDIAKGQELRDAIQLVNNETGNLRQMYKAFEDQINAVAGKTSRIDRPIVDSKAGAQFVNAATKIQSRIARSTILGSANSAIAQTGQLPLMVAENGTGNFQKGMRDMFRALRPQADDPLEQSALMTTRYPKNENIFAVKKRTRAANKITNVVAKPFRVIERASSELAWRSSYNRAVQEGLSGKAAIQEADRITAKIIGERSPGARAALYESKALGPVTSYTLEVNQLYQVAKQYFKRDRKRAAKLVGAIWLYNQGYKAVTGNKLNADPLDAAIDAGEILTSDEEDMGIGERLTRAGGRLAGEAIDATPLGGPVVGQLYPEQGFRIPFGGGERTLSRSEVFGDTNLGRYGGGTPIASGISNPLLLFGIPGMSQLQRSVEGSQAYSEGASTTPTGRLRFDIEQDPENYWRSLLFGMYGTREGRAYLEAQNARLAGKSKQGNLRY